MPYKLKKVGSGYKVAKKTGGKTFSKKPMTKKKAEAQMRAMYANSNESLQNFQILIENELGASEKSENVSDNSNLTEQLKDFLSRGATFASFIYKTKGTGSTSLVNVNFNIDYNRIKQEDLEKVKNYTPETQEEAVAKESILNPKARKAPVEDTYDRLGKGILINQKNGEVHIYGWLQNKEIIEQGAEKKPVNSSPQTLAKYALCKKLELRSMGPSRKIRNYILSPENIGGLKLRGNVIEFQ
jgi:hypothetical protein